VSLQDVAKVWAVDCDTEFKLALLWIAEDSSSDGFGSYWRYNPQRLCEITQIPPRFISMLLGTLMEQSVLIYDEKITTERGEVFYQVDIDAWLDTPRYAEEERPQAGAACRKKRVGRALKKKVFERDAYRCQHSGGWEDLCADHVIPESKGGQATIDNLQTLCRVCNSRKGDRL